MVLFRSGLIKTSKTMSKIVFLEISCVFKWRLLILSKGWVCPLNLLLVHCGYSIVCWRRELVMKKVSHHLLTLKSHLDLLIPLRVLWFSWRTGFYTAFQCLEPRVFYHSFWKLITALKGWVRCHGACRSLLLHLNCYWISCHTPHALLTHSKSLKR